jgi:hypothetical protein
MERGFKMKTILLAATIALSLRADTQFRAGKMTRDNMPFGKGRCDIRLQIDKEAEVQVRGDTVWVRTLSGREALNDGSQCNEPLPSTGLQDFNFEVLDGRGEIVLLSPPSRRNEFTAVVRIRDNDSGSGRYLFRLSWRVAGFGSDRRDSQPANPFGMNQAVQICQEAVVSRIVDQYRYGDVDIRNIRADDNPGRRDYLVGEATARRGHRPVSFTFVCAVDFSSGRVRSVDVRKH